MQWSNIRLYYDTSPTLDPIFFDFPVDSEIVTSPFILRSIEGLGPPDINLTIPSTLYSGGVYQGSQPLNREIIMKIGFQPDYSVDQNISDLRAQLYSLASTRMKKSLTIEVQDAARDVLVETSGYIKKIEPNIFSNDPELVITITCLGPYWKKWGQTAIVVPTPPEYVVLNTPLTVVNPGDAPSGFKLVFTIAAGSYTTYNVTNAAGEKIEIVYAFSASNAQVTIDTTPGQRTMSVHDTSGVGDAVLLPYQSSLSKWLMLDPGENVFTFLHTSGFIYLDEFTINANYWGV